MWKFQSDDASAYSCVTTTYAIFGTIFGLTIITSVKNILYDTHWLTKCWARFGLPYYWYDTVIKILGLELQQRQSQIKIHENRILTFIKKDPAMFIHHIIFPSMFYPVILYFRNDFGDFIVAFFYAIDFVVPFIQLRHVLYRLELKTSCIYVVNGVFMTVAFAVCRVAVFPYLYLAYANFLNISVWTVPYVIPKKCTIACGLVMALQMYWLGLMIRGVINFFRRGGEDVVESKKDD